MSARSDARVLSRLLRWGLLLAVLGQIGWSMLAQPSEALTTQELQGRTLYNTNCTTCHGLGGEGTANGPSLQGVGAASVSFMLSSGRMPLNAPGAQPTRQEPQFTPSEIAAIVAYVRTIAPGGPEIPNVDVSAGNLSAGRELFLNNCSGCHGAAAPGDSVGGGQIAPSLYPPNATQVGEAIRTGPGVMPKFNPANLSDQDLNSIARYLGWLRSHGDAGGAPLGRVGAVAEGLVAMVVGLGLLILVLKLTGSKL